MIMKSDFNKNIITLITGATAAQVIPFLFSPVISRIYSASDFGVFALYMTIVSIASVFSTGRYEMAIILPKNDKKVKLILNLILLLLLSSVFFLLVIVAIYYLFYKSSHDNEVVDYILLIPISVFVYGIYQAFNYILIREKKFRDLSLNKVYNSIINISVQISCALIFSNAIGLLLGVLLSNLFCILLIIRNKITTKFWEFEFQFKKIKYIAYEYVNFPKYDVPSVLINVISNQLPLIAFAKYFGMDILGYYAFMYKVLMTPLSLLSNNILDVFRQKATEDFNKYGNCKNIFWKTFKNLIFLGALPFLILGLFSPNIFALIFGEQWRVAGEFAQIMSPMFFLNFLVNPLSYTFFIAKKQKLNLMGQVMIFLITLTAIAIGVAFGDAYFTVAIFSLSSSIIYLCYLMVSYKLSLGNRHV